MLQRWTYYVGMSPTPHTTYTTPNTATLADVREALEAEHSEAVWVEYGGLV